MPLTRPAEIRDGVSLVDKLGRTIAVGRLVAEDGALDSILSWNGVVDVFPPDEHGVSGGVAQDDVLAGTDELHALATVGVAPGAVVAFVEPEAGLIAIFRQPPEGFTHDRRYLGFSDSARAGGRG